MNVEAYKLSANKNYTRFQFQSIGKRGIFEKVILITSLSADIYNLALLDYDPDTNEYSDQSTTDNGDLYIVLATVIAAVKAFLREHTNKSIYFKGNTLAKTRLYQLSHDFIVYGIKNEMLVNFEPNIHFEGFLIQEKH